MEKNRSSCAVLSTTAEEVLQAMRDYQAGRFA